MIALLKGVLRISAMASVMILIVIAMRRGMSKRLNPKVMVFLWLMVLIRLCLPITFQSPIHISELIPEPSIVQEAEKYLPSTPKSIESLAPQRPKSEVEPSTFSEENSKVPSAPLGVTKESNVERAKGVTNPISIWSLMTALWIAGIVAILTMAIREAILFKRKLLLCRPIEDMEILQMVEEHLKDYDIDRQVSVLKCNYVQSPGVFGYIKPQILLPDRFTGDMDKGKLNSILLHEICHIERHDLLINYIWLVAKAVHWFNPLVWIAYRLYQDDIELCRDQMVASRVSEDERLEYSASLIEAARFSNQNRDGAPSIATSFYKNTSKLKERVIRLVKPQKKSRALAMTSMVLAMLMLIMCFTTACKPTPEGPVVVGKDGKKLEEGIKTKGRGGHKINIKNHKDSFKGADKNVTVNIDANVVIPKGKMPVVKVEPYKIPMEQVKAMAEVLFQGNPVYETQIVMTKGELEEKILELKREVSDEEALLRQYDGNQETVKKVKENYEQRIAEYEELYATAPETHTPKETDWTFHTNVYYQDKVEVEGEAAMYKFLGQTGEGDDDAERFQATSVIGDYRGAIQVRHDDIFGGIDFSMGSNISGDSGWWDSNDDKPMDISKEEAVAMVYDALEKMGITHMQLFRCTAYGEPEPFDNTFSSEEDALKAAAGEDGSPSIKEPAEGEDVYSYSMTFVPTYEGVAVHDMSLFYNGSEHDINHFYENIIVNVHNEMITYFSWSSPMGQVEVENDDVAIVTFKEATEIFKKQMGLEYTIAKLTRTGIEDREDEDYEEKEDYEKYKAYYEAIKRGYEEDLKYLDTIESGEIHITDIELKLMRIKIQNRPGEYRMVPAWMFFGYEELHFKDGESKIQEPVRGKLYPYAVINAIDGSIINIQEGY